jgi:ABC-type phosphate/phosphonate transport system substrate-binding protein
MKQLVHQRGPRSPRHGLLSGSVALTWVMTTLFGILGQPADGQQGDKTAVMRIGASGSLALNASGTKEETAIDSLQSFIKSQTGLDNEILRQKNWRELAEKMAKKELQLGIFQGFEFAWAREKHPGLQPLAIAVNVYPSRYAYVLTSQNSKAKDFAGLQGQSLAMPVGGEGQLRLFVERLSQAQGKQLDTFFSRITKPENLEDALDDVVDGVVESAVVDRVGLEAYKRRKPGRFSKLKEVAQSPAFPPPLVAYYDATVDKATLQRFQDGLLGARQKEKGRRLLTLFKLTGFQTVPDNFDQTLAETRKAYPQPKSQ